MLPILIIGYITGSHLYYWNQYPCLQVTMICSCKYNFFSLSLNHLLLKRQVTILKWYNGTLGCTGKLQKCRVTDRSQDAHLQNQNWLNQQLIFKCLVWIFPYQWILMRSLLLYTSTSTISNKNRENGEWRDTFCKISYQIRLKYCLHVVLQVNIVHLSVLRH